MTKSSVLKTVLQFFIHQTPFPLDLASDFIPTVKKNNLQLIAFYLLLKNPGLKRNISEQEQFFLKNTYFVALEKNIFHQEALKELIKEFDTHQIPFALLRGQALGLYAYPDPALRAAWDLDLLVPPECHKTMNEILFRLGYKKRTHHGEIGYFRDQGFGIHLDIHTDLWYEPKMENIWNRCMTLPLLDVKCRILSPEDHIIHVIYHAIFQHARFNVHDAIDLALLINKENIDWAYIAEKTQSKASKSAFHHALHGTVQTTGINIPKHVLEMFRSGESKIFAYLLQKMIKPEDRELAGHFLRPFALPTLQKSIAFILKQIFPPKIFLQDRYETTNASSIFFYRIFRPIALLFKIPVGLLKFISNRRYESN